jgi:hypothetical protein
MATTKTEYELDEHFLFTAPADPKLAAQVLTANLTLEGDEIVECRFEISAAPEAYARIEREGLFNLTPEARLPSGARFNPAKPVLIELALHADWLEALSDGVDSADEAVNRLFEWSRSDQPAAAAQPVLATGNWYALRVKQEVDLPPDLKKDGGKLFEGYSTTWA